MMTAPAYAAQKTLDIGRVFSRFTAIVRLSFVPMLLACGALWLVSLVVTIVSSVAGLTLGGPTAHGTASAPETLSVILAFGLGFVLFAAQIVVVVTGVSRAALGERPKVGATYTLALSQALPVLAIAILSTIAVYAGLVVFIVPGVIVGLVWAVATQVRINENVGVFQAFSRSAELTRNNRLMIFATNLIFGVGMTIAFYIVLFVVVLIFGGIAAAFGFGAPGAQFNTAIGIGFIVMAIVGTVLYGAVLSTLIVLYSAVPAAIYAELVAIKGGGDTASVFS
jgi:hypothetical protein